MRDQPTTGANTSSCRGFTLIELLVVIAIIALLVSILMPVLGRARELARRTGCLSNLHGLALSTQMYIGDFDEFPFNWDMAKEHDEYLSHDCTKTYSIRGPDGNPAASAGRHPHISDEGGGALNVPYWTQYFLVYRYSGSAQALGCTFTPPSGWKPAVHYAPGGEGVTMEEILKWPTYVYRGPSSCDDLTRNRYSGGGQIAWNGSTDNAFYGSAIGETRTGTYYPLVKKHKKPKPLFHCPVIGKREGYSISYIAPHAPNRSLRNDGDPAGPMSGAMGSEYHYVAESVGWSDGRATAHEQPSNDRRAWYINYLGEVTTSYASRF